MLTLRVCFCSLLRFFSNSEDPMWEGESSPFSATSHTAGALIIRVGFLNRVPDKGYYNGYYEGVV